MHYIFLSLFCVEKPLSQETDATGDVVRIDDIVLKSGKASPIDVVNRSFARAAIPMFGLSDR